jgi:hypothetical protein
MIFCFCPSIVYYLLIIYLTVCEFYPDSHAYIVVRFLDVIVGRPVWEPQYGHALCVV